MTLSSLICYADRCWTQVTDTRSVRKRSAYRYSIPQWIMITIEIEIRSLIWISRMSVNSEQNLYIIEMCCINNSRLPSYTANAGDNPPPSSHPFPSACFPHRFPLPFLVFPPLFCPSLLFLFLFLFSSLPYPVSRPSIPLSYPSISFLSILSPPLNRRECLAIWTPLAKRFSWYNYRACVSAECSICIFRCLDIRHTRALKWPQCWHQWPAEWVETTSWSPSSNMATHHRERSQTSKQGLWSARHRAYDRDQWREIVETVTLL